ncbi:flagellar hook-length control protein FliK [Flaviflagellibacter deserti]|uniref:Flagellar hook-length control protein FliK n=1 Tax=Flaviflagellibacter deserti TaxID=2267266 RepID=A0ABV9Z566_9HYPH
MRNIGARISTNPVATVRPIEGTSLFPLGQLVEAKVAAVLADGLFKFISSDGGEFELPLPEKLPEGTPVRVSAKPDGSVTVTVTGEAPDQSEAMIAAALKEAVRGAAAKQATMSPLFATLEELPDRPDLPQPVRQAVQRLLSMRTPFDAPPRPAALAQAISRSGLFTEAQLATSPDTPPPLDLKAALSSLRAVVQTLVDAIPLATTASAAGQSVPAPAATAQPSAPPSQTPGNASPPNLAPLTQPTSAQASPIPPNVQAPPPPQNSGLSVVQVRPQVPVSAAVSVSPPTAVPAQSSLRMAQVPAAQLAVPVVAVMLQGDEAIQSTAQPSSATGAAPQTVPNGQGGPVSAPQQMPAAPAQAIVQSQLALPAPDAQTLLPAPTSGSPRAPQMPIVENGAPQPAPGASVVTARGTLLQVSPAPLPAQPATAPMPSVAAQPQPTPPQTASVPSVPQVVPPAPPSTISVPPGLPGMPEAILPQGQPAPGPLVRAATLALAQAAALPIGEPNLPLPGQQPAPAPGHLYPSAQKPDAPPPTHGSPPVSHAPVDAHDALRAAAQTQPLEEIAPRLLADTEAAISRVSLHQMASLPDDHAPSRFDAPDARWSCEIPIALDGRTALMGFVVERDGKKNDDPRKQKRWRVQAALDLPETGPLQADVQMRGTAVVAGIWVERSDIAQLLEEALPLLRDGLTAAGFDVEELNVRLGHLRSHLPPPGAFLDQRS